MTNSEQTIRIKELEKNLDKIQRSIISLEHQVCKQQLAIMRSEVDVNLDNALSNSTALAEKDTQIKELKKELADEKELSRQLSLTRYGITVQQVNTRIAGMKSYIAALEEAARMCLTCTYHHTDGSPHTACKPCSHSGKKSGWALADRYFEKPREDERYAR